MRKTGCLTAYADLDEATEAEIASLIEWKRYRVALNRITEQLGY
ncbi:tail fiber assembly protein [Pseudomonas plecoglossicida]|uniref:Phage tail protein n=1 Tax=Pseudomonas plecoglossicida TaxID=70775 RepID=A0AAD0QUN2_PSEDL|nr:tail fiber assembly protein [Pseudomonas plecoglossicida]AXM95949.1 hypothetical protein DVB73_09230 [Pseudomonas plecoglossicida]QLB56700.1 tail fiber assembly protein [Pseudomonas plecoglossicida]